MDRRERLELPTVAFRAALQGWQSQIWTALPGIYQGPGENSQTANVQPSVQVQIRDPQGNWQTANLPLCLDCPIIFPGGGGFQLTFPLTQGDEGLIVFASRCIDAWWQQEGIQPQAELRMHDLSDGFFIPGQLSQGKVPASRSSDNVQLKKADGSTSIEISPAGAINLTAPGDVTITGNLRVSGVITGPDGAPITGDLVMQGNVVAGSGSGDQIDLQNHTHLYSKPGSLVAQAPAQTNAPTAGT